MLPFKNQKIILFDGECNLCESNVIFIIKRDPHKKFKFASLQSPIGQEILKYFGLNHEVLNTLVLIINDKYYLKSTASFKILRELDSGFRFCYWLIILPKFLRDWGYDLVSNTRYLFFGKKTVCLTPSQNLSDRFLD